MSRFGAAVISQTGAHMGHGVGHVTHGVGSVLGGAAVATAGIGLTTAVGFLTAYFKGAQMRSRLGVIKLHGKKHDTLMDENADMMAAAMAIYGSLPSHLKEVAKARFAKCGYTGNAANPEMPFHFLTTYNSALLARTGYRTEASCRAFDELQAFYAPFLNYLERQGVVQFRNKQWEPTGKQLPWGAATVVHALNCISVADGLFVEATMRPPLSPAQGKQNDIDKAALLQASLKVRQQLFNDYFAKRETKLGNTLKFWATERNVILKQVQKATEGSVERAAVAMEEDARLQESFFRAQHLREVGKNVVECAGLAHVAALSKTANDVAGECDIDFNLLRRGVWSKKGGRKKHRKTIVAHKVVEALLSADWEKRNYFSADSMHLPRGMRDWFPGHSGAKVKQLLAEYSQIASDMQLWVNFSQQIAEEIQNLHLEGAGAEELEFLDHVLAAVSNRLMAFAQALVKTPFFNGWIAHKSQNAKGAVSTGDCTLHLPLITDLGFNFTVDADHPFVGVLHKLACVSSEQEGAFSAKNLARMFGFIIHLQEASHFALQLHRAAQHGDAQVGDVAQTVASFCGLVDRRSAVDNPTFNLKTIRSKAIAAFQKDLQKSMGYGQGADTYCQLVLDGYGSLYRNLQAQVNEAISIIKKWIGTDKSRLAFVSARLSHPSIEIVSTKPLKIAFLTGRCLTNADYSDILAMLQKFERAIPRLVTPIALAQEKMRQFDRVRPKSRRAAAMEHVKTAAEAAAEQEMLDVMRAQNVELHAKVETLTSLTFDLQRAMAVKEDGIAAAADGARALEVTADEIIRRAVKALGEQTEVLDASSKQISGYQVFVDKLLTSFDHIVSRLQAKASEYQTSNAEKLAGGVENLSDANIQYLEQIYTDIAHDYEALASSFASALEGFNIESAALAAKADKLQGRIDSLRGQVVAIKQELDALKTQVQQNAAAIRALQVEQARVRSGSQLRLTMDDRYLAGQMSRYGTSRTDKKDLLQEWVKVVDDDVQQLDAEKLSDGSQKVQIKLAANHVMHLFKVALINRTRGLNQRAITSSAKALSSLILGNDRAQTWLQFLQSGIRTIVEDSCNKGSTKLSRACAKRLAEFVATPHDQLLIAYPNNAAGAVKLAKIMRAAVILHELNTKNGVAPNFSTPASWEALSPTAETFTAAVASGDGTVPHHTNRSRTTSAPIKIPVAKAKPRSAAADLKNGSPDSVYSVVQTLKASNSRSTLCASSTRREEAGSDVAGIDQHFGQRDGLVVGGH